MFTMIQISLFFGKSALPNVNRVMSRSYFYSESLSTILSVYLNLKNEHPHWLQRGITSPHSQALRLKSAQKSPSNVFFERQK